MNFCYTFYNYCFIENRIAVLLSVYPKKRPCSCERHCCTHAILLLDPFSQLLNICKHDATVGLWLSSFMFVRWMRSGNTVLLFVAYSYIHNLRWSALTRNNFRFRYNATHAACHLVNKGNEQICRNSWFQDFLHTTLPIQYSKNGGTVFTDKNLIAFDIYLGALRCEGYRWHVFKPCAISDFLFSS